MKKTIFLSVLAGSMLIAAVTGQGKYMTSKGTISFYSHTLIEDITAVSEEVASVIDTENGNVSVIVKMTSFQFEKKLMQEHFNENYVESHKFPKSTFTGRITNNADVDYTTEGTYKVTVEGELTIHGVTNGISADGTIEVGSSQLTAKTKFMVNPADYDIKIPRVVRDNIAERLEVTIVLPHDPI